MATVDQLPLEVPSKEISDWFNIDTEVNPSKSLLNPKVKASGSVQGQEFYAKLTFLTMADCLGKFNEYFSYTVHVSSQFTLLVIMNRQQEGSFKNF